MSVDFRVLWGDSAIQSWSGVALVVASFSFSVFLLELCGWNIPTPSHMDSERRKECWVEIECAFNICWGSGTHPSTRGYTKLSGSSIAQASKELTASFLSLFKVWFLYFRVISYTGTPTLQCLSFSISAKIIMVIKSSKQWGAGTDGVACY